jgi:glycosyltransferase involved in cell wall biosynthesis
MRIGIRPALERSWGGIYQHTLSTLHAFEAMRGDEFVLLVDDPQVPEVQPLVKRGWTLVPAFPPERKLPAIDLIGRALGEGRRLRQAVRRASGRLARGPAPPGFDVTTIRRRPDLAAWWARHGIEMVFYATPSPLAFEVGIPHIITVHDVQHRLQPELLEVTDHGEWERREYLYRNCWQSATHVLVDSEGEKQHFLSCYGPYGVPADRVTVLPMLPAPYLDRPSPEQCRRVSARYHLPARYLFYPAGFWPHKNHARIIQALERLKLTRSLEIPIVLCGSHGGQVRERQFRLLMQMAEDCGVAGQFLYIGSVPDEDMGALYAGAAALVMPTLFGPSNIPPLEAWASDCPVVTSDIPGTRDQLGDAAILIDPRSAEALAEAIAAVWTSEELRERLIHRGRERRSCYTPADFRDRLSAVIGEAKVRVTSMRAGGPREALV